MKSRKLANGNDVDSKPLSNTVFHDCIKGLIEAIDERTSLERDKFNYIMKRNAEADESKRRLMKTLQVIYDNTKATETSPSEVLQKLYEKLVGVNHERKKFTATNVRTKGKKIKTR